MLHRILSVAAGLRLVMWAAAAAPVQELRPGVWASSDLSALPLPVSGYEVYLVGEMHGVKETEDFFLKCLAELYTATGLRDIALEEKAAYERNAQAYVEGKSSTLPEPLCLRAGILAAIQRFNEGRKDNEMVRVHLVGIDSPASAIRQHLLSIRERSGGRQEVQVPDSTDIKERGLGTVAALQRLTTNQGMLSELRTVEHSIRAYQQGFEVGTGQSKGSPYLDDREEAAASNIIDLLRHQNSKAVLALYGFDHVSKARRKDGGEQRNRQFSPLALRLQEAGVKVFSLVTFPLSGRWRWRGREGEMLWTAKDGRLTSGETLDRVLAAAPDATLLYVDRSRQQIRLPSQDVSSFLVDAFVLFPIATPMEDHCAKQGN